MAAVPGFHTVNGKSNMLIVRSDALALAAGEVPPPTEVPIDPATGQPIGGGADPGCISFLRVFIFPSTERFKILSDIFPVFIPNLTPLVIPLAVPLPAAYRI